MAIEKILLPDFGEVKNVIVVELFISPGDQVEKDASLMSLESDKAVMDLPSPFSGIIKEIFIKEEDQLNTGDLIASIEISSGEVSQDKPAPEVKTPAPEKKIEEKIASAPVETKPDEPSEPISSPEIEQSAGSSHATPSVRAYARELDIDLSLLTGTGPKGRILKSDVQNMVKNALKEPGIIGGTAAEPLEDFSRYGVVEEIKLGRIQKISGPHLHKSWISIPHVTHFDEADIEELERFRKDLNRESEKEGIKYSILIFIIKALTGALKSHPAMNSSLKPEGDKLVLKKFYNLGIAVDTPLGLVVPVIKDADKKGIKEISLELKDLSLKAREGKLSVNDLQGASFTISSLGGIGGTAFTPIINRPQVGILGLSASYVKAKWDGNQFKPVLTLPFSLSYDHRVIDGAEAARFCRTLARNIEDLKRILL
jgi:pyruvate dehydrogenase E2 component (dihydrolipoamide acetyltransferase)